MGYMTQGMRPNLEIILEHLFGTTIICLINGLCRQG